MLKPLPLTLRPRPRDLMLVDLDCFFVSVERVRDPALRGRPVIVGGLPGERGVVACASYEARRHGVTAGMPIFQAQQRLPERETVYLHGDHTAYMQASAQVMAVLERFTPAVTPLSLDEALLDLAGCERHYPSWMEAAHQIRATVHAETGLALSIGIGGTRAVTHVATALAKPKGILEVRRGEEAAFLAPLPLSYLPGVGPSLLKALERFHLQTIGDLARIPQDVLEETFGRVGISISQRARGLDAEQDGAVESTPGELPRGGRRVPQTHSISRETSFAKDTCDPVVIDGMLSHLAQRAALALRKERGLARFVGIRLRYSDFRTVEARCRLPEPSDQDAQILWTVHHLWPTRYDRRVALRLVGVVLGDVVPVHGRQLDLFEDVPVHSSTAHARTQPPARERATAEGVVKEAVTHPNTAPGATLDPESRASLVQRPHGTQPQRRGARRKLEEAVDRIRDRHGFGAVLRGQAIGLLGRIPIHAPHTHDKGSPRESSGTGRVQKQAGFRLRTPGCSKP